jgi:hypothetical protein
MAEDPFVPPAGWTFTSDNPPGTAAVALEPPDPQDPGRFRANLVLTLDAIGQLSFSDWQNGTDELLPRVLTGYLVVDLEHLSGGDRPAGRRLAAYVGPQGQALTMEQWFTRIGDLGHTLTATVETVRYDELADTFRVTADQWRLSL